MDRLIDTGLITSRVLVPEQFLTSGTLTLLYMPGRISGVRDRVGFCFARHNHSLRVCYALNTKSLTSPESSNSGHGTAHRLHCQDASLRPESEVRTAQAFKSVTHAQPLVAHVLFDRSGLRFQPAKFSVQNVAAL